MTSRLTNLAHAVAWARATNDTTAAAQAWHDLTDELFQVSGDGRDKDIKRAEDAAEARVADETAKMHAKGGR